MIIIWGSRLYGKVDEVPGLFHVATKFGHLWYVPLIPMESHLIFDQDSQGWRGLRVNMRWKSVFVAWLRAGLVVGTVVAAVAGLSQMNARQASVRAGGIALEVAAGLMAAGAVASWVVRPIRRASYERAVQLAEQAGLSDEARILIERHFGRITDEQARAELEAAARDRAEMEKIKRDLVTAAAPEGGEPDSPAS